MGDMQVQSGYYGTIKARPMHAYTVNSRQFDLGKLKKVQVIGSLSYWEFEANNWK